MNAYGILAVGVGAALGAWLRWVFGLWFNAAFPPIPPGTVLANLVGGYVIGVALGLFSAIPSIAPEWRLFIVTGFCGGLTTFSTFSAELSGLLQQGRIAMLGAAILVHVGGSVTMTLLGIASARGLVLR